MPRQPYRTVPTVEWLEDRSVPTVSTTTSNFNGTAIPAGDTVWFSSVFKVNGLGSGNTVNLYVANQTVTLNGNTYNLPNTHITFSPASPPWAATSFDATTNTWNTVLPLSFSGNAYLGGFALPVPGGLPGGLNPVKWSGDFTSDKSGVSVNWQWAAAVYTSFGIDYNALKVKPVDSSQISAYTNSDHAGTPEAYKSFVVGGARGGGGSNFTGSYSATGSVQPSPYTPPPPPNGGGGNPPPALVSAASLAGVVYDKSNGGTEAFAGVTLLLTGTDVNGNAVNLTTTSAADGTFGFANLAAGTYAITATPPSGYVDAGDVAGSVDGGVTQDGIYEGTGSYTIDTISLASGQSGVNYQFGLLIPSA